MIHKLISTIGLGILGVDPFTAVYLLSMGLRQEKNVQHDLDIMNDDSKWEE